MPDTKNKQSYAVESNLQPYLGPHTSNDQLPNTAHFLSQFLGYLGPIMQKEELSRRVLPFLGELGWPWKTLKTSLMQVMLCLETGALRGRKGIKKQDSHFLTALLKSQLALFRLFTHP